MNTSRLLLSILCSLPLLAQSPLTLEELERIALERHPSIKQAHAMVQAAAGRKLQAGLYPNPTIGATGEEIHPGPVIRYGEWGGFVSQRIVTGGKLGLGRQVAAQGEREVGKQAEAQRLRVLNSVRSLYYRALGDQRLIEVRSELKALAARTVQLTKELINVGLADKPDLLAAEIEEQNIDLDLISAQNGRDRTWRQLAAAVNDPALRPAPLAGDLDAVPQLDLDQALETIYSQSPELGAIQAGVQRSELELKQSQRAKIPDIVASGGLRYNRELLEQNAAGRPRPVGREGFFDVGVEIPIFNRNQGNIAVARAARDRSRLAVDRTRLMLRSRLASVYKDYRDSVVLVDRYKNDMIPKSKQVYELYLGNFRQMAVAYPRVLDAQRRVTQLQERYVVALVNVWQRVVEIQGLLVSGDMVEDDMRSPSMPASVMMQGRMAEE